MRFVSPPCVLSPSPAACVQNRPSQSTAAARLSVSIAPGEVTSRTCSSPVRRPSRTTRLRSRPRWSRRSHALEALLARPGEHLLARGVAALGREQAVVERHDLVEAAGRVEAAHERAVRARAERVLELVAVAPLLDRGHDRLLLEAVELADPAQRVADLLGLDLELALVGEHLPRRAGMVGDAARSGRATARGSRPRAPRRRRAWTCRRPRARGRRAARRRRRRRSRRGARRRCRRGRACRRSARARRRGRGAWKSGAWPPFEGSRAAQRQLALDRAEDRSCGSRSRARTRAPCAGRRRSCRRARARPRRR